MIFIHSFGSTANRKVSLKGPPLKRKSQGNSHVSLTCFQLYKNVVISLNSTDNKHGVQRQVHHCRQRRNFIYYIEYFRKATGILLLGIWCKHIRYNIPIITLVGVTRRFVSPRKVRSPSCKPSGDLTFLWKTNRRVTLQQGW